MKKTRVQKVEKSSDAYGKDQVEPKEHRETGTAGGIYAKADSMSPLVERALRRSGLAYGAFVSHLTQMAFRGVMVWTQTDLERLLIAAERHGLDPLSREVFMAQPSFEPTSPLVVVVGVDGWSRILNAHAQFDGVAFAESGELNEGVPTWIECTIYRRDRRVPLSVREYLCEARGVHQSWITHPRRMLRHRALVQCARLAFGLSGVLDADEAQRVHAKKANDVRFVGAGELAKKLGALGENSVAGQAGVCS